jgi:hypothetical protein
LAAFLVGAGVLLFCGIAGSRRGRGGTTPRGTAQQSGATS